MRYFKYIFVFLLCINSSSLAFGEELKNRNKEQDKKTAEAMKDIADFTRSNIGKNNKESVEDFKKAMDLAEQMKNSGRLDWLNENGDAIKREALIKAKNKQEFWKKSDEASQVGFASKDSQSQTKAPEDNVYVFLSLSMKKETIKSLFRQGLAMKEHNVVFVTRGWKQKEFTKTLSRWARLFPGLRKKSQVPAMRTDPNLFNQMGVKVVPAISYRKESGMWVTAYGLGDIEYAIKKINDGANDGEKWGQTFAIEEPDLIEEINRAAREHDWEKDINRIKDGIFRNNQMAYVPDAYEDESYLVDMSITVKQTLKADGNTYARKGDRVNPLHYLSVPDQFVFADVNNPKHLKVLREWKKEFPLMKVSVIEFPEDKELRHALDEEFGRLSLMNNLLVRRFKLKGIPAMAMQEGMMMKITTRSVE